VRRGGRLRVGRVLALGLGVWFRRFVPIHLVTAVCLAPLVLLPASPHPIEDGTIPGLFGLYSSAWLLSFDVLWIGEGLSRNTIIGYLAQFAVTVILVREAHRRLAARPPESRFRAMVGLVPFALGSLAAFFLLDLVVTAVRPSTPLPLFLAIGVTVAETFLATTFWLALPAAALDGHGFLSALGRSRHLAPGSRLAIAVAVVLLAILEWTTALLLGFAEVHEGVVFVPAALFVTVKACVLAAAYRETCLLREGPPAEEISAVFA
jgi:hypothetical protein